MNTLNDTLNGGYAGLYAEVVTHDCYRIKTIDFTPDLVYDIGANVGVFTRFARSLWPNALIIAVEPHPDNVKTFIQFTPADDKIFLLPWALGKGSLWHNKGARNGSGESYVSSGLGFDENTMALATSTEKSDIDTIMLDELVKQFCKAGMKTVCKIDIEGGENIIWADEPSMEAMHRMDYICMETHFYALHGGQVYDEMKAVTLEALKSLEKTHNCHFEHPHFQARKK